MGLLDQIGNISSTSAASAANGLVGSVAGSLLSGVGGSFSYTPKEQRSAYQFVLAQSGSSGRVVRGYLQSDFGFSLSSSWAAKYEDAFQDSVSPKVGDIASLFGIKLTNKFLSYKFYQGSGSVSFGLDLVLLAENGPEDIVNALRSLYFMTLPTTDGAGWISAPGPKIDGAALKKSISNVVQASTAAIKNATSPTNSTASFSCGPDYASTYGTFDFSNLFTNTISLQIGNFLTIPSVVITGIDNTFKVKMTPSGVPLQATVRITVETHNTPTAEDVSRWILYNKDTVNSSTYSGASGSTLGGLANSGMAAASTGLSYAKSAIDKMWS